MIIVSTLTLRTPRVVSDHRGRDGPIPRTASARRDRVPILQHRRAAYLVWFMGGGLGMGRIGFAGGAHRETWFDTEAEARQYGERLAQTKQRRGYVLIP